ncbi:MAG: ketopantoate reductase family protein [Desulfurococcales archaeon]|nr:ketopantoate reductase family protein [Desulfurococcales archaeon]
MEACIIGCGAVGCLLAYYLHKATGEPVKAIVRRAEQAEALRREGARIEGVPQGLVRVDPHLPGEMPPGSCSHAIIATKAYDAPKAYQEASRVSRGWIIAAVNGFPRLPRDERLAWLVVEYGVARLGDNRFRFNGGRGLVLGAEGSPTLPYGLARLLEMGGARVRLVGDVRPYRWGKAAVNAGLNPVTAILGVENGFVLASEYAWSIASRAALEVAGVARGIGVALPYDPVEYLRSVAEATRGNTSSMLQDVLSCRRTEADEILGEVISTGRRVGASVGTLETLYFLVKSLEARRERECVKVRR